MSVFNFVGKLRHSPSADPTGWGTFSFEVEGKPALSCLVEFVPPYAPTAFASFNSLAVFGLIGILKVTPEIDVKLSLYEGPDGDRWPGNFEVSPQNCCETTPVRKTELVQLGDEFVPGSGILESRTASSFEVDHFPIYKYALLATEPQAWLAA